MHEVADSNYVYKKNIQEFIDWVLNDGAKNLMCINFKQNSEQIDSLFYIPQISDFALPPILMYAAAMTPNIIATGGVLFDGLKLWDVNQGKLIKSFNFNNDIPSMSISHDNKYLAFSTGSIMTPNTIDSSKIFIYELNSGKVICEIINPFNDSYFSNVLFSNSNDTLFICDVMGHIYSVCISNKKIVNAECFENFAREQKAKISQLNNLVLHKKVVPIYSKEEEANILSNYFDTLLLTDYTFNSIRGKYFQKGKIVAYDLSPDMKSIVSVNKNNEMVIWETERKKITKTYSLKMFDNIKDVNYINSGEILIITEDKNKTENKDKIFILNIESTKIDSVKIQAKIFTSFFLTSDKKYLIFSNTEGMLNMTVGLYDINKRKIIKEIPDFKNINSFLRLCPTKLNNKRLFLNPIFSFDIDASIYDLKTNVLSSQDGIKAFYDTVYNEEDFSLDSSNTNLFTFSCEKISNFNIYKAIMDINEKLTIYNLLLNSELFSINKVERFQFSNNDKYLICFEEGGVIEIWDIKNKSIINSNYYGKNNLLTEGNFVMDDSLNFIAHIDTTNQLKGYNLIDLQPVELPKTKAKKIIIRTDLKNLYILTTNDSIIIYNYLKNQITSVFSGLGRMKDFFINSDGHYLVTTDMRRNPQLYDIKNNCKLIKAFPHESMIMNAFFSDNDDYLCLQDLNKSSFFDLSTLNCQFTFISEGATDYIFYTPDFYYYSTKGFLKRVGFSIKNKIFPFEQFELQYNRPDIVLQRIGMASDTLIQDYYLAYQKRLEKMGIQEEWLKADFHSPELTVVNDSSLNEITTTANSKIDLHIKADDDKYPILRLNVWVNDVNIFGMRGKQYYDSVSNIDTTFSLPLSQGKNKIQVSVLSKNGGESLKSTYEITYQPKEIQKPDLYIVGIGVKEYMKADGGIFKNLMYAEKDISAVIDTLRQGEGKYYNKVHYLSFLGKMAVKDSMHQVKSFLKNSKVDDVVLVYCSGHGKQSSDNNFYFGTYDFDMSAPQLRGLAYDTLESWLDGIPARQKLLLIDACQSGEGDKDTLSITMKYVPKKNFKNADQPEETPATASKGPESYNVSSYFELSKILFADLRRGTGATIISAAGAAASALEGQSEIKNGYFTYSFLKAIKDPKADKNKDGYICVSELQEYIQNTVETISRGLQKPTSRLENLSNDFIVW